jgi:hypothetical protein
MLMLLFYGSWLKNGHTRVLVKGVSAGVEAVGPVAAFRWEINRNRQKPMCCNSKVAIY